MVAETIDVSCAPSRMGPGELIIGLRQAEDVGGGSSCTCVGNADMYVTFAVGGEKRRSKERQKVGKAIRWDEQFSFKIAPHVKLELYNSLHVSLLEDEGFDGEGSRGAAKIDVRTLLVEYDNRVPPLKYPIFHHGKQRGSLELAISFIPLAHPSQIDPDHV